MGRLFLCGPLVRLCALNYVVKKSFFEQVMNSASIEESKSNFFWQVSALLGSLLILLPDLLQPFNNDIDIYQTMGWQLVHFHQLPYIGSWDQNFPGIAYFHAAIIFAFGTSPLAFRVITVLLLLGQSMTIFWLCQKWFSPRFAFFAAIFSATLYMSGSTWLSGQRDAIAGVFIFFAITLVYRSGLMDRTVRHRRSQLWAAFVSGLLMGAATMFRPTNALFLLALAVVLLYIHRRNSAARLLILGLGYFTFIFCSVLPYLFVPNGLQELYLATIRFNMDVYATKEYSSSLQILLHHREEIICDGIMVLWIIIRMLPRKIFLGRPESQLTRADKLLFLLFVISARFSIVVMGKYFVQHYAMLLALTAFFAADIVDQITSRLPHWLVRPLPLVACLAFGCIVYSQSYMPYFIDGIFQGVPDPIEYSYRRYPHGATEKFLNTSIVVDYLERHHVSGGRIECWGMTPAVYWRTHTASASRFTMMHPLVLEKPEGGITEYQHRWQREFIDSLLSVRPRYILIAENTMLLHSALYYEHTIPAFDSVLNANYVCDTTLPGLGDLSL